MKLCRTLVFSILLIILQETKAQGCQTTFELVGNNVISRGAVATTDTTDATCEQSCRSNSACKSYQLDKNPGHELCWIQTQDGAFVQDNLYIDRNITEYKKVTNCNGCQTSFKKVEDNVISRGATKTSDTTDATCEQACRSNTACKSYQLDRNLGHDLCWIQTQDGAFNQSNLYIDRNITEYIKQSTCDNCYTSFTNTTNFASSGAVLYSNITNAQDCRSLCIILPSCVAYQIDISQGDVRCWIRTSSGQIFYRPDVTEFTKVVLCQPSSCPPIFTPLFENIATSGATPKSLLTTDSSCKEGCLQDAQCYSYQIDTNQNRQALCWFQTDYQKIVTKAINSRPGVFEYLKDTTYCNYTTTTTLSTASTSSVPLVGYSFESQTPEFASIGAIANPSLVTGEACKNACLAQSTCVSYQINSNPGEILCWLQFDIDAKSKIYLRKGVTEYFKVRATQTSSSVAATSTASTTSGACPPIFNAPRNGAATLGAAPRTDLNTEAACRDACTSASSCVSYQIDNTPTRTSLCWLQNNPANLSPDNVYSRPGVNEYIKNTTHCITTTTAPPCPPSFNEPKPNNVSAGAKQRTDIFSEIVCKIACLTSSACISYQIEIINGTVLCWIQENPASLNPAALVIRPGIIEYVKNTTYCLYTTILSTVPPCNLTFIPQTPDGASINAIPNATFQTNGSCREACYYDNKCLSYQLNRNPNQVLCWLQFDQSSLSGPRYSQPGVVEYIKSCATEVITTAVTSRAATSSTCVIQYGQNPANQASLGAIPTNAGTFSDCQAACTPDPKCVSFQISTSPSSSYCWLQKNADALQSFYRQPNVTEYVKYCAESTTTVTPGCETTFQALRPGQTTIQAQRQIFTTEAECRNGCLVDPTCLSYQINSNPNSALCWFQKNAQSFSQLYYQERVQEYQKICSTPVTTAPCATVYTQQTPGSASIRATPAPSISSDDQCRQACTADNFCLSYQINMRPNETRCWLQRSSPLEFYFNENVTEYIKGTDCDKNRTTSSSPTSPPSSPTSPPSSPTTAPTNVTRPSTTSSTIPPAHCSVIYQVPNPGYLSLLAEARPTLSAVTCEGNCTSEPRCVSYQIVDSACWHQLAASNLNNLYYTDLTYFEYVKICTRECTSTTFYEDKSGFISRGAEERSQFNEVQCRDACITDLECKSYQVDRSSGAPICWHQRQSSPFLESNTYPKHPLITEFIKFCGIYYEGTTTSTPTTTSATTTTTSSPSTATPRRTPSPRITTPTKGVNVSSSSASPISSSSTSSSTSASSSVTPNIRPNTTSPTTATTTTTPRTTSDCQTVYTWNPSQNQNMAGGSFNRAVTLQGCQDACIALDACIAIDFDQNLNPASCYLLMNAVPLTPAPGVTHYDLVRSQQGCVSSTITTTTTPPISSTCSSVTKSFGVNADAGVQVASNVDEGTCLGFCGGDPLCISVDYAVVTRSCYVHRSQVGSEGQANNCCIRYNKCTGTNQPSSCRSEFSEFPNYTPDVRRSYSQFAGTLDSCRGTCLQTNCTSFSYFSSTLSCYLFRGEVTSIGVQAGSTLYIRNFCLTSVDLPPTTTSTTLATPLPGECFMDLALLLDSSGSINENTEVNNWELLKDFAQTVVFKSIRYGYYLDHLALVTFSDSVYVAFDFNKYFSSFPELLTTIKSLPFAGAQTNIPAAMNEGRMLFQDPTRGARANTVHVMVLITDGVVSPPWTSNFLPAVALLNSTNIKRFVVGVGNQVSLQELTQFASPGGVALVPSFSSINDALKNLTLYINQFTCSPVVQTQYSTRPTAPTAPGSTSTTTTGISSTTTYSTPSGEIDCTFGGSLSNNVNGPVNPLLVNVIHANRRSGLVLNTDSCRMGLNYSNSLVEVCVGIPGNTVAQIQTSGAFPTPIGFDWLSTSQNDVETGCRSAIVGFSRGVAINLVLFRGGVYSLQRQTGWSSFSVTNTISNPNLLFSGYSSENYYGYQILRFPNPLVTPTDGIFNTADNTYECRNGGYYFFSFSAGVPANQNAMLKIDGLSKTYYAQRLSSANGLTTISRSILVPCNGRVRLILEMGSIVNGDNSNLISFTAFPYNTKFGPLAAWAAYKDSSSGEADPLNFEDWVIVEQVRRSDMSSVVVLMSGYYYVYVSIGTVPGRPSSVSLRVNGVIVFTIDRRSTSFVGSDVLGRGVVLYLQQNDIVKVVVERGFSISSSSSGYQTSFFGVYLGA